VQLDQTRVVVRERSYLEIMDLALRVLRTHAWQILLTSLAGVVPLVAFNAWLLADYSADLPVDATPQTVWSYVWRQLCLLTAELPLAGVPTTVFLGYALFEDRPPPGRILRDVLGNLGQLLLLVVLPRMPLALLAVWIDEPVLCFLVTLPLIAVLLVSHVGFPYVTEIILLERNPLLRKRPGGMSTLARTKHLHLPAVGDSMGRFFQGAIFGLVWVVSLWFSLSFVATLVASGELASATAVWTIHLPLACWTVASVFTVIRYLSYLDQRIRSEGWEVELLLKAEAARLARRLV
jgi:hypothetical protein